MVIKTSVSGIFHIFGGCVKGVRMAAQPEPFTSGYRLTDKSGAGQAKNGLIAGLNPTG
jgi:hypothetical protein